MQICIDSLSTCIIIYHHINSTHMLYLSLIYDHIYISSVSAGSPADQLDAGDRSPVPWLHEMLHSEAWICGSWSKDSPKLTLRNPTSKYVRMVFEIQNHLLHSLSMGIGSSFQPNMSKMDHSSEPNRPHQGVHQATTKEQKKAALELKMIIMEKSLQKKLCKREKMLRKVGRPTSGEI